MSRRAASLTPIAELLPHRPPMLLLDLVLEHDERRTICRTTVREEPWPRSADGLVPSWIALEYMAQCIGAHTGLRARAAGGQPPLGFLIGSQRVDFHRERFQCGQALLVVAEHVWGETSLGAFACRVDDATTGQPAAAGVLKVFASGDLAALGARRPR